MTLSRVVGTVSACVIGACFSWIAACSGQVVIGDAPVDAGTITKVFPDATKGDGASKACDANDGCVQGCACSAGFGCGLVSDGLVSCETDCTCEDGHYQCSTQCTDSGVPHDAGMPHDAGEAGDAHEVADANEAGDACLDGGNSAATYCQSQQLAKATADSEKYGGSIAAWQLWEEAYQPCADFEAAVMAGRVVFDGCADTVRGTATTGGACQGSLDCPTTDWCSRHDDFSCGGTCTPLSGLGESCGDCQAGLNCDYRDPNAPTCVPLGQEGDFCGPGDANVHAYYCADDLICDTATSRCVAFVTEGGSCNPAANLCAENLACNSSTKTCVTQTPEGAACNSSDAHCATNTYCDPDTETCKRMPSLGEPCGYLGTSDAAASHYVSCFEFGTYCQLSSDSSTMGTCAAGFAGSTSCGNAVDCPRDCASWASTVISTSDDGALSFACVPACPLE